MYEVLDNIPFTLDFDRLMKTSRLRKTSAHIEESIRELIKSASAIARPKAVYRVAAVENKAGDSLELDGVRFTSRVMSVNLGPLNRAFPYIATCGREVDETIPPPTNVITGYYLDIIKINLLGAAIRYMTEYIKHKYDMKQTSAMNPGSLADWPLVQQKPLFSLFPDVEKRIGVRLMPGNIMQPLKSSSGVLFTTEVKYENCQLCPREKCPGRRAPYDPGLMNKYSQQSA